MRPFTDWCGRMVNNHALWSGGPELKGKAVSLHAMKTLGERSIAPTHSRFRP
jgi:hypothetical protein